MGPRQLEVSAHDLLSLDAGISLGFPGLFSSDTHVLCDSGPVLPSFWASGSPSLAKKLNFYSGEWHKCSNFR